MQIPCFVLFLPLWHFNFDKKPRSPRGPSLEILMVYKTWWLIDMAETSLRQWLFETLLITQNLVPLLLPPSLPPSHPCLSFPTSWIHFLSIKLQLQCPIWRIGIYQCVIDREFIIGCGLVTFQKQRSGHYSLKTIVITWPGRRVSLACIASTAFKGKGESIVAEGDRRHISRQTGLNAYIKSESFAGTGNISYPGVRSTCRPQPAIQEERGGGRFVILCRSAKMSWDIDELL